MKWIRAVSASGVLFGGLSAPAQENPDSQAMYRLVEQAITHNRDLLAAQERIRETEALLRQAGIRPVPTLELEGATGRPLGTRGEEEFSAGYFYPLETGGKREKRIQVAAQGLALAKAEYSERLRELALDVRTREIESLAKREKLDALDQISRVNQDAFRLTEARVQRGDAAALDQQLLSVENNRTESQRLSLRGQAEAALFELRRVIGLGSEDSLQLGVALRRSDLKLDLARLKQAGLDSRSDLQIARLLEAQGTAQVALIEAGAKPDITLSARYAHRDATFEHQFGTNAAGARVPLSDRDNIVSFGVSIPLQNRRRNEGNIAAAVSRRRGARLRREYLEGAIPLEIEAAYHRWQAAQNALAALSQGVVDQSEKNLAVIRQAYQLGQLRLLDVLNEQRRLLDTELTYIDVKTEFARAEAAMEHAVGGRLR